MPRVIVALACPSRSVTTLTGVPLAKRSVRRDVSPRDRCLWLLLFETAARANEVLNLNVEDVDLAAKRAFTVRKGGDRDVLHFQTRSARLLAKVINGRTSGPLFLSETVPAAARAPAALDRDPATGRARLSYRRAAEIFSEAAPGRTLHQLRHSGHHPPRRGRRAATAAHGQVPAPVLAHAPKVREAQRRCRRRADRRP